MSCRVISCRFKPLRFRAACSGVMWSVVTMGLSSAWAVDTTDVTVPLAFVVVVLSVVLFCCLSVLWTLKQPGPVETGRSAGNTMKRRAFNIILVNLGVLLGSYMPIYVVLSLNDILPEELFERFYITSSSLGALFGIVQPLLYLHKAGKLTGVGCGL